MTLLVDGLAGMGKTYLLRDLIEAARSATPAAEPVEAAVPAGSGGWQVTYVRADEIESGEPYSFIERFIASSGVPDWHFVPDGQTSPIVVARECIRRLVGEGETRERVMIIDDAQWIDVDSQRVLRYMIPRVTRRSILLAFGVRTPHDPDSFGEFLTQLVTDSPLDLHYQVAPLTAPEITALALDRLGIGISALTAQRMLDVTGGSFLRVDSMLAALTADEISQLHFAWDTPIRSQITDNDILLHQFNQLSPEAQGTSELVCLAGHELSHDDLAEAARVLGEPVNLDEAIRAGVLGESGFGSTIMPRHALLSQAVSATVAPERARAVYQALAQVTEGYRSLRHTLLGAEQWNDELHERVNTYVLNATGKGNLSIASEVLRAALALATDPADRMSLLESLALVHMLGKTGYLMLDLIDEIEQLPYNVLHEFMFIVISAHKIGQELPMERIQRLLASTPETPDDRAILAFFAFMIVILSMRSKDLAMVPALIGMAKGLIEQAPSEASELTDPRLGWMVQKQGHLLVLDSYLMVQDQMMAKLDLAAAALPELTRRIDELPDQPLKVDAMVAVAGAQLAIGNVGEGRTLAQQGVDLLDRVSEPWAASTARLILADCMVLQGDLEEASELMSVTEEIAYTALDIETRVTWAALRLIITAISAPDDVAVHAKRARGQHEVAWEGYGPDLAILAECELARMQGDTAAILHASSGSWADGILNTRHGFLTYRANALIDTGRLADAAELVEQLAKWRGTRWQEYWGTLDWLRARLAQANGDAATARWHYEAALDQRAFPLPLGLTLADFGRFLIEQGQNDAGREVLESSIAVLEQMGAESYLAKIRAEVGEPSAAVITATGRDRERLLNALTDRERQIVEHLVKGRSNNQIAESLVVSVTTVRSHVSNVLRKLHLSSRGEVARLLRHEAEATS